MSEPGKAAVGHLSVEPPPHSHQAPSPHAAPPTGNTAIRFPPAFVHLSTPFIKLFILGNMLCMQKGKEATLLYLGFLPKIRVVTRILLWTLMGGAFLTCSSTCISLLLHGKFIPGDSSSFAEKLTAALHCL